MSASQRRFLGIVLGRQITKTDPLECEVTVKFDQREVVCDFDELDEVALAHAIANHKSQGSRFPAVIIPLATQHCLRLQRNLLRSKPGQNPQAAGSLRRSAPGQTE